MSNYFNNLPIRVQLEELGKCRFMEPEEFSNGVEAIKDKKIVIVGLSLIHISEPTRPY